ncbi:class I SAM-dependent methyltransferase, partial [Candidatus Woesearchaeota archaeon]|nr:class I SAM-dependent methyltransferase [Candidatus Woesearchaeota archaeon]
MKEKQKFYEKRYSRAISKLDTQTKNRVQFFAKNIGTNKKVLEISSGEVMPFRFYDPSNEIHLIDISRPLLELAKPYVKKTYHLDIDSNKLPFQNNTFDVVVAGEIIEHLLFPAQLISECHRVLKPRGIFLGSTPNAFVWRK